MIHFVPDSNAKDLKAPYAKAISRARSARAVAGSTAEQLARDIRVHLEELGAVLSL